MNRSLIIIVLVFTQISAAAEEPKPVRVFDDFETWEWKPITAAIRRDGKKRLADERELGFEYRGPLYRGPTGFILPAGSMVDGADAFKGKSVILTDCQVGLHGRYSHKVRPGSTYRFALALKGKGVFQFRVWVQGINIESGERKWLGFPDVIRINAADSWKTHEGTFELPRFDDPEFRLPHAVSAAIVIDAGDRIYLDDFLIEEDRSHGQDCSVGEG